MADDNVIEKKCVPQPARRTLRTSTGAALFLLVLLAFAFNGYYLWGGFQGDDFFFLNMMRQDPRPYSRWLGFWAVDDVPAVTNTWWFEGRGVGVFWRPVPSLIFEGTVRVFGERAFCPA